MASFIVGSENDTRETPKKIWEFARRKKLEFFRIFPKMVVHPDGQGLGSGDEFVTDDWKYFNGNYVLNFPEKVRPSELQREVMRVHEEAVSAKEIARDLFRGRLQLDKNT